MKYSHIFFDWHGVLSHSKYWAHTPEAKTIEKALFGEEHPLLKQWSVGKCDMKKLINTLSDLTNIPVAHLVETLKESCERQELASTNIPDLIISLRSRGVRCIIATDNFDIFDKWTVPALGLDTLFDNILNSHNLGHVKPELAKKDTYSPFFSPYLETNNVSKAIWFDDNDYSRHAKKLGMDFKLVKPGDDLAALVEQSLK